MQTFFFHLRPQSHSAAFIAACSVLGKPEGFHGFERTFTGRNDVIAALDAAGISRNRYSDTVDAVGSGLDSCFEISINEAQKLDVLRLDSPE